MSDRLKNVHHASTAGAGTDLQTRRTGSDLHAFGDEVLRMSGCLGAPLTELLNVVHLHWIAACQGLYLQQKVRHLPHSRGTLAFHHMTPLTEAEH